jgi:hypothetical protein
MGLADRGAGASRSQTLPSQSPLMDLATNSKSPPLRAKSSRSGSADSIFTDASSSLPPHHLVRRCPLALRTTPRIPRYQMGAANPLTQRKAITHSFPCITSPAKSSNVSVFTVQATSPPRNCPSRKISPQPTSPPPQPSLLRTHRRHLHPHPQDPHHLHQYPLTRRQTMAWHSLACPCQSHHITPVCLTM